MTRPQPVVVRRHAVFGGVPRVLDDGTIVGEYRHRLERDIEPDLLSEQPLAQVCWLMLNSSTADHRREDPTVTRCLGFTRDWGYERMTVVNLYDFCTAYPKELKQAKVPCSPANDEHIVTAAREADLVVCAWGAGGAAEAMVEPRVRAVLHLLDGLPLWCLGYSKEGQPRHPLMLAASTQLVPFNEAARLLAEAVS